jgi:hypothetical protein
MGLKLRETAALSHLQLRPREKAGEATRGAVTRGREVLSDLIE